MLSSRFEERPWSLNRNLKIKHQILIISFLFYIIIVGILFGAAFISQQFLQTALKEASNNIFQSQTKAFLNFAWINEYSMEQLVAITTHHISTVRKLNSFVQVQESKGKHFIIPQPKMCLTNKTEFDSFCYQNSMSCGVFGTHYEESESKLKNIMITTSLMDVLRLEYDFNSQSPILFAYNDSTQYYCIAIGLPFPAQFKPLSRPYYLESIKKIQNTSDPEEFIFASPYLTVANKIRCPITTALLDLNEMFIGLIAKDLDFNYTQIIKPHLDSITTYVLAQDGKVVFTDKYRILGQPVFYLNETQYSGFNQQDYEQIMFKHYGKQFQSNCQNFQFDNVLCRYNTILLDNVIVRTVNITTSPYILVILSKTNEMKQLETKHVELLKDQINIIIKGLIITAIAASTVIFVFSQLITNYIFRQFNDMIQNINKLINRNHLKSYRQKSLKELLKDPFWLEGKTSLNQIKDLFQYNLISSNCVSNLTQIIVNLFHDMNGEKKSDECLIQENLQQYLQSERVQLRNLIAVKQLKSYLKNNLGRRFSLKIISMILNKTKT